MGGGGGGGGGGGLIQPVNLPPQVLDESGYL